MIQNVRYRYMTIPSKLTGDIHLRIDDKSRDFRQVLGDDVSNINIQLLPIINVNITRPLEKDADGLYIKRAWNPNDSLGMTKYQLAIFIDNWKKIYNDMKIPSLYIYTGDQLDLNEKEAKNVRRVFTAGNQVVELMPIVIYDENKKVKEGIRMKINDESSTVHLSLDESLGLISIVNNLDVDTITLMMYNNYIRKNRQ